MTYASQAQFGNYSPASFGWAERDPFNDPSLIVPFSFAGVSFDGGVHVDFAPVLRAVLTRLVPLIPGGLVQGQCGCYNPNSRTVGGGRSFHTWGIAADLDWGSNPMYAPQRPTGPYALPPATSVIAHDCGCEWGGDWTYPQDWMHIETHLPPAVARTVTTITPSPTLFEEDDMYLIFSYNKGIWLAPLSLAYKRGFKSGAALKQWQADAKALGAKFRLTQMDAAQAASIPTGAGV